MVVGASTAELRLGFSVPQFIYIQCGALSTIYCDATFHFFRGALGLTTIFILTASAFTWDAGVTAPTFTQTTTATASATGKTTRIQAQSASGTGSTGGDLIMSPGTGVSANGRWGVENVAVTPTAPSAGAADPLPALPVGYMTMLVNGQVRKVAYY
jgi:hypothetical protein